MAIATLAAQGQGVALSMLATIGILFTMLTGAEVMKPTMMATRIESILHPLLNPKALRG